MTAAAVSRAQSRVPCTAAPSDSRHPRVRRRREDDSDAGSAGEGRRGAKGCGSPEGLVEQGDLVRHVPARARACASRPACWGRAEQRGAALVCVQLNVRARAHLFAREISKARANPRATRARHARVQGTLEPGEARARGRRGRGTCGWRCRCRPAAAATWIPPAPRGMRWSWRLRMRRRVGAAVS